ncbi:MAG: LPS export ABC transporter periplasmic protein LptC [Gemmatimonadaceae bacterium]|nr:LPS export ABC transporter periplasmic protein LptC [Gemmatimonadaceae bacterium]
MVFNVKTKELKNLRTKEPNGRKTKVFITLFFSFLVLQFFSVFSLAEQAKESDQQIGDFSLSGFGDKGKKAWDLSGKRADIFNEVVKLKEVVGNHYADKESIKLTADSGDFNKSSGVVHLEDNVVITTSGGAKLTTDSLDWDRKQQIVSTLDKVNLQRLDMNLSGVGAVGATALKQVEIGKDVRLEIEPKDKQKDKKEKIVITCDGPLEVDYEKNIAVFNNNVKVEKTDLTIYSDKMQVYFTSKQGDPKNDQESALMSNSINKIVSQGNVRIVRGENTSYSQEAVYTDADKKIILTGRPQIVIYQTENIGDSVNAAFGN